MELSISTIDVDDNRRVIDSKRGIDPITAPGTREPYPACRARG